MAVYFARAEGTDFVKIGYASNVERRMRHLQAGCPYKLTVVRVVDGDRIAEAAYHQEFADDRIDREWFRWNPAMMVCTYDAAARSQPSGSFSGLIDELGGTSVVAKAMNLPFQHVHKFYQRNRIPAWHWPALKSLGVSADRLIECEVARAADKSTEAA